MVKPEEKKVPQQIAEVKARGKKGSQQIADLNGHGKKKNLREEIPGRKHLWKKFPK